MSGLAEFYRISLWHMNGAFARKREDKFGMRMRVQGIETALPVFVDADIADVEDDSLRADLNRAEPAAADMAHGRGGPGLFGAVHRYAIYETSTGKRSMTVVVVHP